MISSSLIGMVIYVLLLILVYVLIITEVVHKSIAALIGAAISVIVGSFLGLFDVTEVGGFIDLRTLGIIIGVMILVDVSRRSGLFQFIALKAIRMSGYKPRRLFVIFCLLTAFLSGIIGNITAMLIIGTLTVLTLIPLGVNPVPFLIAEVIISNVGSLMTLIGGIPPILVSSAAGLSFFEFTVFSMPFCIALVLITINILLLIFKKRIPAKFEFDIAIFEEIDPWVVVTDKKLFWKSLIILSLTIILFIIYDRLRLTLEFVAMLGGVLLLFLSGVDPEEVFRSLDWGTIFFFVGFFVLIGSIERSGLLEEVAKGLSHIAGSNILIAMLMLMWIGGLLSAVIDNIPITLTLIPVVKDLSALTGLNITPLWWALLYGVVLGGNFTPLASPCGITMLGIAKKEGYGISFKEFVKVGAPLAILQIFISFIYVILVFGA
nr:ArsB/NhaD family transporter [Candidatus Baldrarchaeota archaeon]